LDIQRVDIAIYMVARHHRNSDEDESAVASVVPAGGDLTSIGLWCDRLPQRW
jgi:hypothetical protein